MLNEAFPQSNIKHGLLFCNFVFVFHDFFCILDNFLETYKPIICLSKINNLLIQKSTSSEKKAFMNDKVVFFRYKLDYRYIELVSIMTKIAFSKNWKIWGRGPAASAKI